MKNLIYISMITLSLILIGCSQKVDNSSDSSSTHEIKKETTSNITDSYLKYSQLTSNENNLDSYTAIVNSTYEMAYSDNTSQFFVFDGVFEMEDKENPKVHLTQNIESNGDSFNSEGYYYDSRLYNSYNGIKYYEDMSFNDIQKTMLVPMKPYNFKKSQLSDINGKEDENGNLIFTIKLNTTDASDIFSSRYDTYGLNQYDRYTVDSSEITDSFDSNGNLISETSTFRVIVSLNGQQVNVTYQSSLKLIKLNSTEVSISKKLKKQLKEYVYFENIDTSNISENTFDDTEEKTVVDTFKKRLVNRLGYTVDEDGLYQQKYNDNEMYTIDFKNYTFTYTNYSIHYTYNWKGNIGTMGACTVNFGKDKKASSCEESTADMIQTVEQYFEMELYYCGLSLNDLQNELKK